MNLTNYLKSLMNSLIDSYKKQLFRTMGTAFVYTILCFVVVALLLRFSDFDHTNYKRQISLLSYFCTSYSSGDTYSMVDLTNAVFLFFASLFSITLIRNESKEEEEFKLSSSVKSLQFNDLIVVFAALIACALFDFIIFKSDRFLSTSIDNKGLTKWLHGILMYPLRYFIPWVLFSLVIYKVSSVNKLKLNFRKICFLFTAFWIINAFSYELSVYVRAYLFDFLMIPLDADKKFFFESILGLGLVGFNFVGYYAVMTRSVTLLEEGKA